MSPAIGDTLDEHDDEPPVGTIVEDEDGTRWQRTPDVTIAPAWWVTIGGACHDDTTPLWSDWTHVPGDFGVTVVSVPAVAS